MASKNPDNEVIRVVSGWLQAAKAVVCSSVTSARFQVAASAQRDDNLQPVTDTIILSGGSEDDSYHVEPSLQAIQRPPGHMEAGIPCHSVCLLQVMTAQSVRMLSLLQNDNIKCHTY